MDPFTLLTVVGSVASIISARRDIPSIASIRAIIRRRLVRVETLPNGTHAQVEVLKDVSDKDLDVAIKGVIELKAQNSLLLERIDKVCYPPYERAIKEERDNFDLSEAQAQYHRCVCEILQIIRKGNGGVFPEPKDKYREYWKAAGCGA